MTLERLLAQHRRDTPHIPLDILLIDPHEPGGGRIWRRDQSPLLKLNTLLSDAAVFPNKSCELHGPIEPGPSLAEWIRDVRAGLIARPNWWDDQLEYEISTANDQSFPTRRLNSAYLAWAYVEVLRRAHPNARVTWLCDRATAVNTDGDVQTVHLESGKLVPADIVVYTLGHNGSAPSSEAKRLQEFAQTHELAYVPPAFTADQDYEWLQPKTPVIVRGMGLAAVDLVVLLTEGRGGVFTRTQSGRLRYAPSGREPRLFMGSRRGVPYRSKTTTVLQGDAPELEYLGREFRDTVARADQPLDFDREVWPLVAAELLTGYYRELFTGHPERVHGTWNEFHTKLRTVLALPDGYQTQEFRDLIVEHVPRQTDWFDLASFDQPLTSPIEFASRDKEFNHHAMSTSNSNYVDTRVREHIARDVYERTTQVHSAHHGLFMAMLYSYFAVTEVPQSKWNARSRTTTLPKRWHTFFSYLASGPPGHRLEEFLALAEAGVLSFIGADLKLLATPSSDTGPAAFQATGRVLTDLGYATSPISAGALIDAWLPEATAARSDNPLLRHIIASGQGRELAVVDDEMSGNTGQLTVTERGELPDTSRQFALGPFTSAPTAGAFTRPGLNSLPFRRHDHFAQSVLNAVVHKWAETQELPTRSVNKATVSDGL